MRIEEIINIGKKKLIDRNGNKCKIHSIDYESKRINYWDKYCCLNTVSFTIAKNFFKIED